MSNFYGDRPRWPQQLTIARGGYIPLSGFIKKVWPITYVEPIRLSTLTISTLL